MAQNRVLALHREWLSDGAQSGWAFCVETIEGHGPLPAALRTTGSTHGAKARNAVDYKQVLSEADFAVYAQAREWRKQMEQAAGVPVYAVFSNEQLADAVLLQASTRQALAQIEGVGQARIDKWGESLLQALAQARALLVLPVGAQP